MRIIEKKTNFFVLFLKLSYLFEIVFSLYSYFPSSVIECPYRAQDIETDTPKLVAYVAMFQQSCQVLIILISKFVLCHLLISAIGVLQLPSFLPSPLLSLMCMGLECMICICCVLCPLLCPLFLHVSFLIVEWLSQYTTLVECTSRHCSIHTHVHKPKQLQYMYGVNAFFSHSTRNRVHVCTYVNQIFIGQLLN